MAIRYDSIEVMTENEKATKAIYSVLKGAYSFNSVS